MKNLAHSAGYKQVIDYVRVHPSNYMSPASESECKRIISQVSSFTWTTMDLPSFWQMNFRNKI